MLFRSSSTVTDLLTFIPNLLFTQITAVAEILTFLRMMAALDLFIELVTAKVLSITS